MRYSEAVVALCAANRLRRAIMADRPDSRAPSPMSCIRSRTKSAGRASVTAGGNTESRLQEVSSISRGLKALAKDLDVPILALSQLSRAVEQRHDKRPILSDLRESGGIEQDADLVMFIYRDEYYNKEESEDQGMAEVHVAKHRNGPTDTVKLAFLSRYAKFVSAHG